MANLTNSGKLIEKIEGLKSVTVQASAPANPSAGDLWFDSTSTSKMLKIYNGTAWVIVGPEMESVTQAQYDAMSAAEKSNGKYYLITDADGTVVAGGIPTSQPSVPTQGNIYYDTTNNVVKIYNGSAWEEVGGGGGSNMALSGTVNAADLSSGVYTTAGAVTFVAGTDTLSFPQGTLLIYNADGGESQLASYGYVTGGEETADFYSWAVDSDRESGGIMEYAHGDLYDIKLAAKGVYNDLNVKVFVLSSTSDLTTAAEVISWFESSSRTQLPIVILNNVAYILKNVGVGYEFAAVNTSFSTVAYTTAETNTLTIYGSYSVSHGATATSISTGTNTIRYLDPEGLSISAGGDVLTPFIPTDDCQPATKKYVDDLVGDVESLLAAI